MKIFQWVIVIKRNPSGFYRVVSPHKYLSGVVLEDGSLSPKFDEDPSLYGLRSSKFQVSELRRVGYNVFAVPYAFYAFVVWLRARKKKPW